MHYILIPLYNEELNVPNLEKELKESVIPFFKEVFFVFVDDNSSDKTVELLKSSFSDCQFEILTKTANGGPGDSFNIGMNWVLERAKSSDKLITMEADCTSDLGILGTMDLLHGQGYDTVLASPYAQGGGFSNTNFFRKLLSFSANTLIRFVLDLKVHTLSSFYRIYSIEILLKIKDAYPKIISDPGFFSMIEILCKVVEQNGKVIEVPMVVHSEKRIGQSKMKVFKTIRNYLKFIIKYAFLGTKSFK